VFILVTSYSDKYRHQELGFSVKPYNLKQLCGNGPALCPSDGGHCQFKEV